MSFGTGFRSRPAISAVNRIDAFGAAPLNGASVTFNVKPLTGSGLRSASRSSGEGPFGFGAGATGAFPFGERYPRLARTVMPGRLTRTSILWNLPSRLSLGG